MDRQRNRRLTVRAAAERYAEGQSVAHLESDIYQAIADGDLRGYVLLGNCTGRIEGGMPESRKYDSPDFYKGRPETLLDRRVLELGISPQVQVWLNGKATGAHSELFDPNSGDVQSREPGDYYGWSAHDHQYHYGEIRRNTTKKERVPLGCTDAQIVVMSDDLQAYIGCGDHDGGRELRIDAELNLLKIIGALHRELRQAKNNDASTEHGKLAKEWDKHGIGIGERRIRDRLRDADKALGDLLKDILPRPPI